MSTQDNIELDQRCTEAGQQSVSLVIEGRQKNLGDLSVWRILPTARRKMVGPWIFVDQMGPAEFEPGSGINVRPHPHINLATVTYLFEGEIEHRDSLGTYQIIRPGDVNLMIAGRGIVHSERQGEAVNQQSHRLYGLQLWLALPAAYEEIKPEFYHYSRTKIPQFEVQGAVIRLIMGELFDHHSPVKTLSETLLAVISLKQGQSITLPAMAELGIYVLMGQVTIGQQTIKPQSMAVIDNAETTLQASQSTRCVILGGDSPGERFIEWNFVSSRQSRIEQAKQDWQKQQFDLIPGDDEEFIPLPESK